MRSSGPRARHPLGRHFGAQSLENVSGETGRTTSRAASQSSEFGGCLKRNGPDHLLRGTRSSEVRGCLRRNGLDHLSRGISEPRVARMSQAKRAGTPLARHLGAQSCQDVPGETGCTISHAASRSLDLRRRRRRNWPDHLSRGIYEPTVARMSPAKLAGPPLARHRPACEDVSGDAGRTT